MIKTAQNKTNKKAFSQLDTESQTPTCQVGLVFCPECTCDNTLLNPKNSDRHIFDMINELNDEVKTIQRVKPKQKKIKKVQIASWSRADINKLKQLLKIYGTDFQAISVQMGKARDQVKRKYKVLQKKSDQVLDCVFESDKSRSHSKCNQSVQIDLQ